MPHFEIPIQDTKSCFKNKFTDCKIILKCENNFLFLIVKGVPEIFVFNSNERKTYRVLISIVLLLFPMIVLIVVLSDKFTKFLPYLYYHSITAHLAVASLKSGASSAKSGAH